MGSFPYDCENIDSICARFANKNGQESGDLSVLGSAICLKLSSAGQFFVLLILLILAVGAARLARLAMSLQITGHGRGR